MTSSDSFDTGRVYLNPVHNRSCPDPFVLKHRGEYWCYTTGFWHDGRCFGVLHSRDLVNWRELGGAMEPFADGSTCYWAPEVTYHNGRFLMYYSVGDEVHMQIRLSISDSPEGPFIDSGHRLTREEFAIDPHVFADTDGSRFMFYATDFLEHTHIGTGTVYDRMIDEFTLAGEPRPVARARYDWQVYDPRRKEKGGVRWHTVEGPFVLKYKGRYYEMFSGGNWQNITYGVSYATSDRLDAPGEWEQASDGERVLPILRTIPGKVTGPGHNSVVRGTDNRQLFCVYHRWSDDGTARVLSIDRQDWAGERMIVLGPTTTPQPAPLAPAFADFFDQEHADGLGEAWQLTGGYWMAGERAARQESVDLFAQARLRIRASSFVAEVSLRATSDLTGEGAFGVELLGGAEESVRFLIVPSKNLALVSYEAEDVRVDQFDLPAGFDPGAYHLLRIEVDRAEVKIALDEAAVRWQGRASLKPDSVALFTQQMAAEFSGFALTIGWQDLFCGRSQDPSERGWEVVRGDWRVDDKEISAEDFQKQDSDEASSAIILKGPLWDSYEFVVNARLERAAGESSGYGFYPAATEQDLGPLITLARAGETWALVARGESGPREFALPGGFDPFVYQQFRFVKRQRRVALQYEAAVLGEISAPAAATRVGLDVRGARAAFDMARVTVIE